MTTIPLDDMQDIVLATIDHAAAPPGSAKFNRVPEVIRPVFDRGDDADAWVFVCGLAQSIVTMLDLGNLECSCGNPDHKPQVAFGFGPTDKDGRVDLENAFVITGKEDDPEIPESLRDHPEVVGVAQIIQAEIEDDADRSVEAWRRAVAGHYVAKLVLLLATQAGEVKRQTVSRGSVN